MAEEDSKIKRTDKRVGNKYKRNNPTHMLLQNSTVRTKPALNTAGLLMVFMRGPSSCIRNVAGPPTDLNTRTKKPSSLPKRSPSV